MRVATKISNNRFVNVYMLTDPKYHVQSFEYAERKGVDSIAFLGYDPIRRSFLLNHEYKPPVNEFVTGAFGGSLDQDVSKEEIVIEEARQEAGFEVELMDVRSVGKSLVSTQMNQWCYLYLVYLDKDKQLDRQPENAVEALASTLWGDADDIKALSDWKAIMILEKAKLQGLV